MEKIPTAEEFLSTRMFARANKEQVSEWMIEFAKLHVKVALEAAVENVGLVETTSEELNSEEYKPFITADNCTIWIIDNDSILNSYPEDLIK